MNFFMVNILLKKVISARRGAGEHVLILQDFLPKVNYFCKLWNPQRLKTNSIVIFSQIPPGGIEKKIGFVVKVPIDNRQAY